MKKSFTACSRFGFGAEIFSLAQLSLKLFYQNEVYRPRKLSTLDFYTIFMKHKLVLSKSLRQDCDESHKVRT